MTDREILEQLLSGQQLILTRLDSLEQRMDSLETRVASLETRVASLEAKVDSLETRVASLEAKVDSLETKVASLEAKVDSLETRTAALEHSVSTMKLHLENITDKNISILAENHLMLVQKLNQAVECSDKNRLYEVKVNYLEEDVKFLKSEVEKINARIA